MKKPRKRRGPLRPRPGSLSGVTLGNALAPPDLPRARYTKRLEALINEMIRHTKYEVEKLYQMPDAPGMAMDASFASAARILANKLRSKFDSVFGSKALGLAKVFGEEVDTAATSTINGSVRKLIAEGMTLPTTAIKTPAMTEILKATTTANVELIKSIPEKYFNDITGMVMRSVQTGDGLAELIPKIEHLGHSTRRRAELIARDQTNKLNTAISRERMKQAGIRKFQWLHSGGGKEPRVLHKEVLNGQIFDIDNPPEIDERTHERGLPGQLINCRCRMVPVISFAAEAVDDDEEN